MDSHEVDSSVRVRGARVHNLREVDYAESHCRYLASVAAYARRLLYRVEVLGADIVTGLPPTLVAQGTPEQVADNPVSRTSASPLERVA